MSRDPIEPFFTDFTPIVDDVFTLLVEQVASNGLLESTFRIGSTNFEALTWDDESVWKYNLTAKQYCYGFDPTIASTEPKILIASGST